MQLHIPKIVPYNLSIKELEEYKTLDATNYGEKLAIKIAKKLNENPDKGLFYAHKDYCGIGLFMHKGSFTLSTVFDGYGVHTIILTFDSKAEFVEWLAKESDQSMALFGEKFNNQTITKTRLDWYLEANYSPVWNEYYDYLRKKLE